MALPQTFPKSPFEIIHTDDRYFPADEKLLGKGSEKLIPLLVDKLLRKVYEWRENDYQGATDTTKQLLT
jgi:type III restriction enzyme